MGKLKVTEHGLKKRNKKTRIFKCDHCAESFGLIKDINLHYGQSHPEHIFQCGQCTKTYASRNALIRHERTHEGMSFSCKDCEYTCMFPYELKAHEKKHSRTGLYPCTYRGCTKNFTTKKGMLQHTQVHDDKEYKCETCGKDGFTTVGYLRQHLKTHKKGFIARCGHASKGPTARQIHQKNCDQCALLLSEKKKKLVYATDSADNSSDNEQVATDNDNNDEDSSSQSSSTSSSTGTSGSSQSSSDSVVDGTDSESDD